MFLVSFLYIYHIYEDSIVVYISWNVWVPRPIKVLSMFSTEGNFMDGDEFDIWSYNQDKIDKVINKSCFKPIEKDDLDKILNKYYNILSNKNKKIFKENFDRTVIENSNNYYAYFEDEIHEDNFLIMILDVKNRILYYLHCY